MINITFNTTSLHWYWQVLLTLALCLFFPSARNLLIFVFKNLYGFLKSLPGKNSKALIERYLNLGRFAFHKNQSRNFSDLRGQYPLDTHFVVLPMDMKYMAAGPVPVPLEKQMKDLEKIKERCGDLILPFVFVDPRRIQKDPSYFVWTTAANGDVVLKDCVIKYFIEQQGFRGFKIYPALGYYPFAPELLPVVEICRTEKAADRYALRIEGPIFYRGIKKPVWDTHPIFTDAAGKAIFLPQVKNINFVVNFTHPLNFLGLLDKGLLAKAVGQGDAATQKLFGYQKIMKAPPEPVEETIACDLADLKVCLAHFGGGDEWQRYLEMDRFSYPGMLDRHPDKGIDFFFSQGEEPGKPTPGKIEQVWKYVDWYSIICSLIIQYENVYSDISFILHDPGILPLLKKTLNFPNTRLRERGLVRHRFLCGPEL